MSRNTAPADKPEDKPIPSDKPNGLDAAALARQVEELQKQLLQVVGRLDTQNGVKAEAKDVELTEAGSHKATARGYVPGIGVVEKGQPIPAGIPVGSWMKKLSKKDKAEAEAEADADEDGLDND